MEQRLDQDLQRRQENLHAPHRSGGRGSNDFFGIDIGTISPKSQVTTGLAVILPVAFSGVFLIAAFPDFWWIFMTYFWVMFPAFGLLDARNRGSL